MKVIDPYASCAKCGDYHSGECVTNTRKPCSNARNDAQSNMSDQYLEAAAKVLSDDEYELYNEPLTVSEIVARRVVEAWVGDRELYEIDVQGFMLHTGEATFPYLKDKDVLVRVSVTEGEPT